MLDYKIMYVSHTGNTQRLAVCIYQSLQQLGNGDIEEITCNTEPGESHLLYVGFCVEKGDCPIEVQELLKKVHNRQIALFGTCGFGQSQEYYDRIVENVKQWIPKDNSCLGAFLCMGKMPMQVRKRYEVMETLIKRCCTRTMQIYRMQLHLPGKHGKKQKAVQICEKGLRMW